MAPRPHSSSSRVSGGGVVRLTEGRGEDEAPDVVTAADAPVAGGGCGDDWPPHADTATTTATPQDAARFICQF
ncbi:hypothetical protein BN11_4650002 [Nostocoides australiense Ben110]|uniref:Uncharacterized protein n=1 Tax=Nostocoides australiense Ben110 TaxID=1193182 RepID=W6K0U2_9MICO|nr:hypothetical protein BN11_4650002 [Tetrasphaera australiensis Ben110]